MIDLTAEHLLRLRGLAARGRGTNSVTALPGGLVTRARGRGLETAEIRAFAPGDDPRHLDRNATARTGQPQTRVFHAERDRTTILIADFRPSMLWGTRRTLRSVAAAEALSLAGWSAVVAGGRVGLIAISAAGHTLVAARARDRAMVRVIGAMVQAHRPALAASGAEDPPLVATLALAGRIAPRGAEVVLASALDGLGQDCRDRILALSNRTDLRVVRIADAFETDAPAGHYRFATRDRPEGQVGQPGGATELPDAFHGIPSRLYTTAAVPEAQVHA